MATTGTNHVIGATYRSAYWGGTYKVIGPEGLGRCGLQASQPVSRSRSASTNRRSNEDHRVPNSLHRSHGAPKR